MIQGNAFFSHLENILLAMEVDEIVYIRELNFWRSLKARQQKPKLKSVRIFLLPNINFETSNYTKLINWTNSKLLFSPMMKNVSTESIKELPNTKFKCLNFSCHT